MNFAYRGGGRWVGKCFLFDELPCELGRMKLAVFIGADPQAAEVARLSICLRWPSVTLMAASDGTQGLDLVRKEKPDLVLVRPDFSDDSLADLIRSLRRFSHVPLVETND